MDEDRLIFATILFSIFARAAAANGMPWADSVMYASSRFNIPEAWIRSVMTIESSNNPVAVSPKGAMGLMQLMPDTWTQLKRDLDILGSPFDPHDNIIAGTAYLKNMYDRFGYPGLFAAYNSGPARYASFLKGQQTLPEETEKYLQSVVRKISDSQMASSLKEPSRSLFVTLSSPLLPQKSRNALFAITTANE